MKDITENKHIYMIAAIQKGRGIGYMGDLIHHIKLDMKHFMDTTKGHSIIMGRKNWESIPEKYRPLADRENIVISSNPDYDAPGAIIVGSLEEALETASCSTIAIIGGQRVYSEGLAYADTLHLTLIDAKKTADTYFPEYEHLFNLKRKGISNIDPKTGTSWCTSVWKKK